MQNLSFKHILQAFFVILLMILLAWIAFYVLIVGLVIGAVAAAFFYIRRFLVKQGIIRPAASPMDEGTADAPAGEAHVTIIETEYHVVDNSDDKPQG
jgi:hypothetical protein